MGLYSNAHDALWSTYSVIARAQRAIEYFDINGGGSNLWALM